MLIDVQIIKYIAPLCLKIKNYISTKLIAYEKNSQIVVEII